jgi:hypothetical protein
VHVGQRYHQSAICDPVNRADLSHGFKIAMGDPRIFDYLGPIPGKFHSHYLRLAMIEKFFFLRFAKRRHDQIPLLVVRIFSLGLALIQLFFIRVVQRCHQLAVLGQVNRLDVFHGFKISTGDPSILDHICLGLGINHPRYALLAIPEKVFKFLSAIHRHDQIPFLVKSFPS